MTAKLRINDLPAVNNMDTEALSNIRGGKIAERYLFSGGAASAPRSTQIINQLFDYSVNNYTYQDDRDFIYADNGAVVFNVGGNYNSTSQTDFTATIEAAVAAKIPGMIDNIMRG